MTLDTRELIMFSTIYIVFCVFHNMYISFHYQIYKWRYSWNILLIVNNLSRFVSIQSTYCSNSLRFFLPFNGSWTWWEREVNIFFSECLFQIRKIIHHMAYFWKISIPYNIFPFSLTINIDYIPSFYVKGKEVKRRGRLVFWINAPFVEAGGGFKRDVCNRQ